MFDPSIPPAPAVTSPTEPLCPFCAIAAAHPPYDPLNPPPPPPPSGPSPTSSSAAPILSPDRTTPASFVLLSTPTHIAFLDIMPLSHGHLLLSPRAHRPKLTDATPSEAAGLGKYVRVLSAALARATGVADWNVVQNNGAAAAQVVPHVHYHVIPRPEIRASGRFSESFTMFGRGTREELDDSEAEVLAERVRREVAAVMKEDEQTFEDGDFKEKNKL